MPLSTSGTSVSKLSCVNWLGRLIIGTPVAAMAVAAMAVTAVAVTAVAVTRIFASTRSFFSKSPSFPKACYRNSLSAKRLLRLAAYTLLLLPTGFFLGACQTAPDTYESFEETRDFHKDDVGLGVGDSFKVSVFGDPSLSGEHRVAPDGSIHFPLIGKLQVEGLGPSEIAELIRSGLQDGYLKSPSVSVLVTEAKSKKVFVLGEVSKPGSYDFISPMSVVGAIAMAGGLKNTARANYVIVTRGERRIPVPVEKIAEGRATNFYLRPGDIIYVPDRLL